MSKIDKITKIFTKTVSALLVEGDRLTTEASRQADISLKAKSKAQELALESSRAFNIASKLEEVLS